MPKMIFSRPTVPKISAHFRQSGLFLEKRAGDRVRLHYVAGLPLVLRWFTDRARHGQGVHKLPRGCFVRCDNCR